MVDDQTEGGTDEFDGTDDYLGAAERPGGAAPHATGPMSGWQRLSQTFLRPAVPRTTRSSPDPVDLSTLSDAERRARINQIDPTERKIGLAAAILAAIFALVYTIPYMVSKIAVATTVKPVHKACADHLTYTLNAGKAATCNGVYPPSHYAFPLVIWLVFAAAILITVRIGRRAPLAFATVLTGLAFGTLILILPFLVAGGWLLLRAWRTQKFGSPTAKAPVEGYVRPPPGSRRRSGGSTAASTAATTGNSTGTARTRNSTRRQRRKQPDETPGARQPPSQNKRYTPKAPPRRKVPPPS
jgi:hypothetical protein